MSNSGSSPEFRVPDELNSLVTDDVLAMHEAWQQVTPNDIYYALDQMKRSVDLGDRYANIGVYGPADAESSLVIALQHQQRLKPHMGVLALTAAHIAAPESQLVVLPADTVEYTKEERSKLAAGDIRPHAEARVRVLEKLGVDKAAIAGYSLGGLTAISMAEVGSPSVNVTHVIADEMPSKADRNVKQLKKDFLKSGGFGDQLKAMCDGGIPVMTDILGPGRLAVDYARFGLDSLRADNKATQNAMAGSAMDKLGKVVSNYPLARIKLGQVAGSRLFDIGDVPEWHSVRVTTYSGEAAHRHPTVNNPMAHGLMIADGLRRV